MSIHKVHQAIALIASHGGDLPNPADPSRITAAENLLSLKFPPSYKAFLNTLGAGGCASEEFYGITRCDLIEGVVPNAIGVTLDARKTRNMPESFIVVGDAGYGPKYVIDTSQLVADGENPILFYHLNGLTEKLYDSFGDFMLDCIQRLIEDVDFLLGEEE